MKEFEAGEQMVAGTSAKHFVAYGNNFYNRSLLSAINGWKNWAASQLSVPIGSSISSGLSGDAWSTRGSRVFASFIANTNSLYCVAIAATSKTSLASNTWDYPAQCILTETNVDGPSIAADVYGYFSHLYAVWIDNGAFKFASMPNCTSGPVGCCADGLACLGFLDQRFLGSCSLAV